MRLNSVNMFTHKEVQCDAGDWFSEIKNDNNETPSLLQQLSSLCTHKLAVLDFEVGADEKPTKIQHPASLHPKW